MIAASPATRARRVRAFRLTRAAADRYALRMPRAPLASGLRSLPAALVGALVAVLAACETPMPSPAVPPAPAPPPQPVVAAPPPASPPAPEPVSLYDKPPPEHHGRPARGPLAAARHQPDERRDDPRLLAGVPLDRPRGDAVPPPRGRPRRAEEPQPSRHSRGLRHHRRARPDFSILRVADSSEIPVTLPDHPCAQRPLWSADGKRFAFQNITDDAVELWVGDAATGAVQRVTGTKLNPMLGSTVQWMPDQKTLLVKTVPSAFGRPPARAGRTAGAEHPGVGRAEGGEQHLRDARHPQGQARRGPLRLLREHAARARRRGEPRGHADRQGGALRRRRRLPGRRAPPRDPRPQALLVRHDVRALPARRRRVGQVRRHRATRSRSCRSSTGFPCTASPPARATSSGERPIRRPCSGARRSTAATGR